MKLQLKKFNSYLCVGAMFAATFLSGCQQNNLSETDLIRFNQLGFYPNEEKIAIVVSDEAAGKFAIRDVNSGKVVYEGELSDARTSSFSDKTTRAIDFSMLKSPGNYIIEVPSLGKSQPFAIQANLLKDVSAAALKAFYYQRMTMPIEEKYAGKWNRPSAHPDDKVMVHPSAASAKRPAGTLISSPKGWYDAGDYNKYIVNSGFTVSVLLSLYEHYPQYAKQMNVNIPESNNTTPDLLDEVWWNLDWMLTMQDPTDGGVYHKLTTPSFEGFIKPIDCQKQRYVVQKSVTAALDFAASMAQASRIYANYSADYPEASETMLAAAKKAFEWAQKNPDMLYKQREINEKYEPAISTGEYGDRNANDEFFWAATELYISTGDKSYLETVKKHLPSAYTIPTWGNVAGLGVWAIIRNADKFQDDKIGETMCSQLITYANNTITGYKEASYAAPYGRSPKDFFWGCNSDAASNQGVSLLYAYQLTKDRKFLEGALNTMDYVLGRNATGYCYVTGFGTKSTRYPHHRLAASDGIDDPLPGFLAGGPNPGKQDGCEYPSDIADECYADVEASYASNEIAINWQGLFTYFVGALNAELN